MTVAVNFHPAYLLRWPKPVPALRAIFIAAGLLLCMTKAQAQLTKTIGDPAQDKFTLYNTFGPMRSVPGAFTAGPISNRHIYIFPTTALNGIAAQSLLDSLAFYKVNSGELLGTVNLKLYLKNVANNNLGAGTVVWDTEVNGATLVYNTSPASEASGGIGYKVFHFSNNFLYTGTNLELLVEYSQAQPATDYISWAWDNITVSYVNNSLKYEHVLSLNPPASLSQTSNIHPVMRLFYTAPVTTPLKLVDFGISKNNKGALLKWKTADEVNVSEFDIQRSRDGSSFFSIGKLGAKNSLENSYEFLDAALDEERAYYRLQIKDRDGKTSYSKTILVDAADNSNKLKLRPNPARDVLQIQLPAGLHEKVILQIVGATGKMYSRQFLQPGNDQLNTTMDISHLPPGNYRLLLQGNTTKSFGSFVKM